MMNDEDQFFSANSQLDKDRAGQRQEIKKSIDDQFAEVDQLLNDQTEKLD
jgi:hypothetical protein